MKSFSSTAENQNRPFEIVFIIDRSGSMEGKEKGIMRGYNRVVKKQHHLNRDVLITTILFDDNLMLIGNGERIENLKRLEYQNGGSTAEYDAVGCAIDYVNARKDDPKNPNPDADVVYFIITDGYENASKLFDKGQIAEKVAYEKSRTDKGRRDFVIMGEFNINVEKLAREISVDTNKAQIFMGGTEGLNVLFQSVEMAIDDVKKAGMVLDTWKNRTGFLKVGGERIDQIRKNLEAFRDPFDALEESMSQLEIVAMQEGLGGNFHVEHGKCRRQLDAFIKGTKKIASKGTTKSIIRDYTKQMRGRLEQVRQMAVRSQMDKLLNANEVLLGRQSVVAVESNTGLADIEKLVSEQKANAGDDTETILKNIRQIERCYHWLDKNVPKDPIESRVKEQLAKLSDISENPRLIVQIADSQAMAR